MKTEIRNCFTNDADKLPPAFQQKLADIINTIEKSSLPGQLPD